MDVNKMGESAHDVPFTRVAIDVLSVQTWVSTQLYSSIQLIVMKQSGFHFSKFY